MTNTPSTEEIVRLARHEFDAVGNHHTGVAFSYEQLALFYTHAMLAGMEEAARICDSRSRPSEGNESPGNQPRLCANTIRTAALKLTDTQKENSNADR